MFWHFYITTDNISWIEYFRKFLSEVSNLFDTNYRRDFISRGHIYMFFMDISRGEFVKCFPSKKLHSIHFLLLDSKRMTRR